MTDRPYKRRIMIVYPEFQFRFIRRIAILAVLIVVASLLLLTIIYSFSLDIQTAIIQPLPLSLLENPLPIEEPRTILSILLPVIIICVAVTLAVTLTFGIVMSHRMAGPLFRIRREMKEMGEGDLSGEIRLRKNDDFESFARDVDGLKRRWRSHIEKLNAIVGELDSEEATGQGSALSRLKEILASFKTN